jgi:acyl carrier protein
MNTRQEIARQVAAVLLASGANPTALSPDSTWEQLGIDPLEVVGMLEVRYGVLTRREDLLEVSTVGQAVDFVAGRAAALNRQDSVSKPSHEVLTAELSAPPDQRSINPSLASPEGDT